MAKQATAEEVSLVLLVDRFTDNVIAFTDDYLAETDPGEELYADPVNDVLGNLL